MPRGDETHAGLQERDEAMIDDGDGGEIMVDVVGSDLSVDGLCGHESGRKFNGKVDGGDELGKEGLDRQQKILDGGDGVMSEPVIRDAGDSYAEGCDGRNETGIDPFEQMQELSSKQACDVDRGGVEVISESAGEHTQVDITEKLEVKLSEGKPGRLVEGVMQKGAELVERCLPSSSSKDQPSDGMTVNTWTGKNIVALENTELPNQQADIIVGMEVYVTSTESTPHSKVENTESDQNLLCSMGDKKMGFESSTKSRMNDDHFDTNKPSSHETNISLDVSVGREVDVISTENTSYSKVANTESDGSDQKLCSMNNQTEVELSTDSTVNDGHFDADLPFSHEANISAAAEEADTVDGYKKSVALENTELPDQRADGTLGGEVEVINTENDSHLENTGSDGSCKILPCSVDNQKMEVELSAESTVNHGQLDADLPSSVGPNISAAADEVDTVDDKASYNPYIDNPRSVSDGVSGGSRRVGISCADSISSVTESQVVIEQATGNNCKISALNHGGQGSSGGLNSEGRLISTSDKKLDYVDPTLGVDTTLVRSKLGIVACEPDGQRSEAVNIDDVQEMDGKVTVPERGVPSTIYKDGIETYFPGSQNMTSVHDGNYCSLHSCKESLHEKACTAERGELTGMGANETLVFKNETEEITTLGSLNHSQEDENTSALKINESSENNVARGHLEFSDQQTQILQGEGDAKMGHLGGSDEDLKVATVLGHKENEVENILLVGEITDKEGTMQVNATASEEQMGVKIEVDSAAVKSQRTVEVSAYDALNTNDFLSGKYEDLKVDNTCISLEVDHKVHKDPFLGSVISDHGYYIPSESSDRLARHTSFQHEKQEVVEQAEALFYEVGPNKNEHGLLVDGMSNDVFEEVLEVTGSQLATTCASTHGDHRDYELSFSTSDFTNLFQVGNESSEVANIVASEPLEAGITGTHPSDPASASEVVNQGIAANSGSCETDGTLIGHGHVSGEIISNMGEELEHYEESIEHLQADSNGEQDVGLEEYIDNEPSNNIDQIVLKPESSLRILQSGYLLPSENEGEFSISDLVWGKVKSHPWWPGQIFGPVDASANAVKYHKKDCFLVAYFGDRTFAWNDASLLKPFSSHFSQAEKQINSEAFRNAVNCALVEVSRRVELGLACSCLPKDKSEKIELQIVENAGIREESSRRYGVDKSTGVNSFQPDKLVEYIRALAQLPAGDSDRLELVIAKAQLMAYCQFKGYRQPPEFLYCEGLVENDATSELSEVVEHPVLNDEEIPSSDGKLATENESSHKRKPNFNDSIYPCKKERNLTELMVDMDYSPDGEDDSDMKIMSKFVSLPLGKKRKAVDSITDGLDMRKSIYAAKESATASTSPKPLFKVGECIRRVASQLAGSPSLIKCNADQPGLDSFSQNPENGQGEAIVPTEISPDEMLSQLHLAAEDPMEGCSFSSIIFSFFSGFRDSVVLLQSRQTLTKGRLGGSRKKKASQAVTGSPEEFEFEDVNDSYWTDRMIHNYTEELILPGGENGEESQLVALAPDKSTKSSRKSRKRYSSANQEMIEKELTEHTDDRKQDLPVELVLNFAEGNTFPSEMNLNKIFRRFGPLNDYETEVDRETGHARVVFKKGSDAEVACSSAGKFNIFGSIHVEYQLNYSPSIAYKPLPIVILQGPEDAI